MPDIYDVLRQAQARGQQEAPAPVEIPAMPKIEVRGGAPMMGLMDAILGAGGAHSAPQAPAPSAPPEAPQAAPTAPVDAVAQAPSAAPPPRAPTSEGALAAVRNPRMPQTPEQAAAIELVRREAAARGLDPEYLTRLAYLESGGNQAAISPKGAIGIMQLMPKTAEGLGVNPKILEQNVAGGLNYFQSLLKKYGNYTDASRAYNWGPGNYDKYLAQQAAIRAGQNVPAKNRLQIPEETRKYLERLMGA